MSDADLDRISRLVERFINAWGRRPTAQELRAAMEENHSRGEGTHGSTPFAA